MVKDDKIEAIFVATDAPSHARHCIEVLNHGKHVCTAVPAFRGDIEDAERLLACVRKNRGLVYAMFETSVFHDDLYAMEKLYAADVFGHIVYSEGEYCHPHSLGAPALPSYKDWRKNGCAHVVSDPCDGLLRRGDPRQFSGGELPGNGAVRQEQAPAQRHWQHFQFGSRLVPNQRRRDLPDHHLRFPGRVSGSRPAAGGVCRL